MVSVLIPQVFLIPVLVSQNLNLQALLTAPRSKKQNTKLNSKFFQSLSLLSVHEAFLK